MSASTGESTVVTDCEDDSEVEVALPLALPTHVQERHRHEPAAPSSSTRQILGQCVRRVRLFWGVLNGFMTVPLWAALGSLIVACVAPLQHALDHDMQPVKGAISSAGNCSIPVTLVVLGAYFYSPPKEGEEVSVGNVPPSTKKRRLVSRARGFLYSSTRRRSETPDESVRPGETKTVIIAVLSRMLITPLLLMPLMVVTAVYHFQDIVQE